MCLSISKYEVCRPFLLRDSCVARRRYLQGPSWGLVPCLGHSPPGGGSPGGKEPESLDLLLGRAERNLTLNPLHDLGTITTFTSMVGIDERQLPEAKPVSWLSRAEWETAHPVLHFPSKNFRLLPQPRSTQHPRRLLDMHHASKLGQ